MSVSPNLAGHADAVVVGAGHNGLVAANLLADRGWDVIVLEAQTEPGGAVRSDRGDDFVRDMFSAFYPLALASPVLRGLRLDEYGLRWRIPDVALAHVTAKGPTAVLATDVATTAESLEAFAPGDGERWANLYREWGRIGPHVVSALLNPFPPIRPALPLLARSGLRHTLRLARRAVLPVRRFGGRRVRRRGRPPPHGRQRSPRRPGPGIGVERLLRMAAHLPGTGARVPCPRRRRLPDRRRSV